MCGRFTLRSSRRIKLEGARNLDLPLEPRYNIAPSQNVLTIGDFGAHLEARLLTWGLIPSWSTDGKGFINARAETLDEKPSFSESFRLRRCLIPADGFFEWKRTGREKRPFYFQLHDELPFAFAGIWDTWSNRGELVASCAIITTAANELIGELHDRMPVILLPDAYESWLDPKATPVSLRQMLAPIPASKMTSYPVSSAVNHPDNENKRLIVRVDNEVGTIPSLF